jgi:protein-S-isoprenylcysteine O-methyltransferase Ste14
MNSPHLKRLRALVLGAFRPPPGAGRIMLALFFGLAVHLAFAAGIFAMIGAMYFGMSRSLGTVPWPYAMAVNALLIVQFPLLHSALLTRRGDRFLGALVPGSYGETLTTTTYALIASIQLFALFAFWTPSGVIWWRAEGWSLYALSAAYGSAWLLLIRASWDAGAEVQSGALGWMSLLAKRSPVFPDMPTTGLFSVIRQPIYVAFALTLWTVPVWTPDQLALAMSWTAYCLAAPRLKERRFATRYGKRFERYRQSVPYVFPLKRKPENP